MVTIVRGNSRVAVPPASTRPFIGESLAGATRRALTRSSGVAQYPARVDRFEQVRSGRCHSTAGPARERSARSTGGPIQWKHRTQRLAMRGKTALRWWALRVRTRTTTRARGSSRIFRATRRSNACTSLRCDSASTKPSSSAPVIVPSHARPSRSRGSTTSRCSRSGGPRIVENLPEERELRSVSYRDTRREEPDRWREAQRSSNATDGRERRVAELLPLHPAERRP